MPAVDDMVCFALYSASRATTQAYRRVLEPWGLTYPQYLVLVTLWTDGPRTVGELGQTLDLDSGTLSPLLRRLERAGTVTRTRRSDDERVVEVSLTELGLDLRERMSGVSAQIATCMGIEIDAARRLLDSLHSLTRSVQASSEATAS
ncbi:MULTISPECIES: MarR family winged helix-turn-helix transcriptional regulator [unclassified Microbacterium]|uniref:MarR family winged helix-turn-helix transcriptional regulator n=1 Tax=unclassified Microbacterium TaxID=2609290 RepID=UPI001F0C5CB4|nr:MarR family transcriptional regulator [Microbacterium sp. Gd 4-13]